MSAPYHLTPRVPAAPHPTPHSASAYLQPNSKLAKAPIHNPYDKFTQPEFDAWIGGITSALRRALGEEEEPKPQATASGTDVIRPRHGWEFPAESEDEAVDDSFAEIKARRTAGKGKARDPREGPGLGKGDHAQPIEIASSDEEEEEEVEFSITVDESAEEDFEEEQEEASEYSEEDEEEEEEGSWEWQRGQSSSQQLRSPARRRVHASQAEEYDEQAEEDYVEYYEEYDEDQEEEDEESGDLASSPIEIISDDENDGEKNMGGERLRKDDEEISGDEGDISIGSSCEEDEEDKQMEPSRAPKSSHPEDEEAEEDMLEEDDEIQEIQPPEDDTSFPPQTSLSSEQPPRHVEIPDPWSGPRTYAEDFYSGGDVILLPGEKVDSSHLGPTDEDFNEEPPSREAEDMEDIDEIQPPQADTSFPQHDDDEERPVELPDPWEGPQTYAEDFYSGGDVILLPGDKVDSSHLGPLDEDFNEEHPSQEAEDMEDIDEIQPPQADTSFPQHDDEDERPVEIPDPWEGPQTYAEDFYSGGDVRTLPGQPIDPSLLLGTGGSVEDIDSFLTPEVLSRSQSNERTSLDTREDEEQEDEQDIPVPSQHYVAPRQDDRVVSADAELITIDDSDEEEGAKQMEGNGASPQSEKDELCDSPREQESDVIDASPVPQEPLVEALEQTSQPLEGLQMPGNDINQEQDEVISNLVNWNNPPAFPTGKPASASGHLATPSPEESEENILSAVEETMPLSVDEVERHEVQDSEYVQDSEVIESETTEEILDDDREMSTFEMVVESQAGTVGSENATVPSQGVHDERKSEEGDTTNINAPVLVTQEAEMAITGDDAPGEFQPVADETATITADELMVDDDDIHCRPPFGDDNGQEFQRQPSPTSSSSQVQVNLPDVYGQLPTPPSEKGRHVELPQMEGEDLTSHHSPPKKHKVEIEEIPDEDDYCPQPPEPSLDMDSEVHFQKALEYTVIEPVEDDMDDGFTDEDADGEIDDDVEVVSAKSGDDGGEDAQYLIEEAVTEGRLTEEPVDRAMSLGVVSVGPDEAEAFHQSRQGDEDIRQEAVIDEGSATEEIMDKGEEVLEEEVVTVAEVASTDKEKEQQGTEPIPPLTYVEPSSPPRETPLSITANADVPGPTDLSQTPLPHPDLEPTPGLIFSSGGSPGGPITDSLAIPQPVVPSLGESILHPSPGTTIHSAHSVDSRSTPAERSASVAPADEAPTPVHEEIQSSPISEIVPQGDLQPEHIDHLQPTPTNEQTMIPGDISESTVAASQPSAFKGMLLTRNPSIPVLMADPYPYSLSTPSSSRYPGHEVSEEEIALDNSLSSNSTLEKEIEAAKLEANILDDLDDLDFQYPPESEVQAGFPNDVQALPVVGGSDSTFTGVGSVDIFADLLKQNVTDTTVPPVPAEEAEVGGNGDASSTELGDLPSNVVGIDKVPLPAAVTLPIEMEEGTSVVQQAEAQQPSGEPLPDAESSQRASKRKRDSSPAAPRDIPSARSTSSHMGKGKKAAKSDRKSRLESKLDARESIVEDTIRVKPRPQRKLLESLQREKVLEGPSAGQASFSTSAAYRMLQPGSRASSIASSTPSDGSFGSQPSPTVNKPTAPPPVPFVPPTSLFHAHGQKRKLMAQITQQLQSQRSKLSRTPSIKHLIEQPPAPRETPSPVIASPPVPPPAISPVIPTPFVSPVQIETPNQTATSPPPPASSDVAQASEPPAHVSNPPAPTVLPKVTKSPAKVVPASTPLVTRSHCRYRRISLPKEEGGPRVCFLVPGCSLNDRELMDEEEIEDHGDARNEDASRIIRDIENLSFDSNLIGVLRQLVGLDILREQEVFYLPQPGEEVVRKMPNPPRKERSSKAKTSGESPGLASSPGYSGSIRSPASIRPPVSAADSTSTSRSVLRNLLDLESEKGSVVGDTNSEFDPNDYDEPRSKRARPSPPDGQKAMGPPRTQSKGKAKARRDDDIFKPDDSELESSPDAKSVRKPRKSAAKRGVKRTRTEVAVSEEGTERRPKKLRHHFTAPANLPESPAKPTN